MAKDDSNQTAADGSPRVHKASELHKRRAGNRSSTPQEPKTAMGDSVADAASDASGSSATGGHGAAPAQGAQGSPAASGASAAEKAPADKTVPFGRAVSALGAKLHRSGASGDDVQPAQDAEAAGGEEAGDSAAASSAANASSSSASGSTSKPDPDSDTTPNTASDASASANPAADSDAEAEGEAAEDAPKQKRKFPWKKAVGVVAVLVVAGALVFAGFVAGSRWVRFNDEADFEGSWYVRGTSVPLTFKDGSIQINESTSYAYRIDTTAKTIEYSLGQLAGQGRYWFSDGRDVLVITDGKGYTMWNTLTDDLAFGIQHPFDKDAVPAGENSIVLSRTPMVAPQASGATGAEGAAQGSSSAQGEAAAQGDAGAQQEGGAQSGSSSSSSASAQTQGSTEMLTVSDIMMDNAETNSEG